MYNGLDPIILQKNVLASYNIIGGLSKTQRSMLAQ